jgi:FkbM family methyltransferase
MDLLGVVRRAAVLPGLRRLTTVTPVIRVTAALRAALVRERWRFALNELRLRDMVRRYTLRDGGRCVVIRHHTPDVMGLDEIFAACEYEPAPEIAAALAAVPSLRVADLGGNIGLFGIWLLTRHPEARIVGYEPDPDNAAIHARAIAANDAGGRWTLKPFAAAPSDGTLLFKAGLGTTSHVVANGEDEDGAIVVEARDPFADLAQADFVKIDIEGGEWGLLADPRFAALRARVLCVEYHPDGAPGDDPGREIERLVRAGGWELRNVPKPNMPGYGLVWGWRASAADSEPAASAQPAASARS